MDGAIAQMELSFDLCDREHRVRIDSRLDPRRSGWPCPRFARSAEDASHSGLAAPPVMIMPFVSIRYKPVHHSTMFTRRGILVPQDPMVLTKQELIDCLLKETRILLHLCGKLSAEMLEYRPTPKQRSTIELLRYLTYMGPILVQSIQQGTFLLEEWSASEARAESMDFDAIRKSLESQASFYADTLGSMSDGELRGEIEMFGAKATRGAMLVDFIVCGHAAYRTQLFCYLKSCGRDELGTMNLWAGVDAAV